MTTRNSSTAALLGKDRIKTSRKIKGVVDAVLIGPPNLSLYLKLQNLLNYFIDCMNNLTSFPENQQLCSDHLTRCINFITEIENPQNSSLDNELRRMLNEFVDDAVHFLELLTSINTPTVTHTQEQTAAVLLTAKASRLQWLSVCILEDLKKNYTHS